MAGFQVTYTIQALDEFSDVLKNIENASKNLGSTLKNIKVDGVSSKMQSSFKDIAKSGEQLGKTLTRRVSLPATIMGGVMVHSAAKFEKSMNSVRAVTTLTENEFSLLNDTASTLGATTIFTASEIADGMRFMGMAGLEAADIMTAIEPASKLAAAGMMDMASASDIATNIATAMNVDMSELTDVVDIMAKTFTSSNVSLIEVGESMKFAAGRASSLGVPIEDLSTMIGLLGNAGLKGSLAGTALNSMMGRLAGTTPAATKALSELGIKTLDSEGNLLDMVSIMEDLEKANLSTAQAAQIFGERGSRAFEAILNEEGSFRKLRESISDFGGTAQQIADIQLAGMSGEMVKLRSAVDGLYRELIDEDVLKFLSGVVNKATELVRSLTQSSPIIKTMMVSLLGIAIVLGPILSVLSKIALVSIALRGTALFGGIAGAAGGIGAAIAGFTKILKIAGLIGLRLFPLTAMVSGLAFLGSKLYEHWLPFKNLIDGVVNGLRTAFDYTVGLVDSAASSIFQATGLTGTASDFEQFTMPELNLSPLEAATQSPQSTVQNMMGGNIQIDINDPGGAVGSISSKSTGQGTLNVGHNFGGY